MVVGDQGSETSVGRDVRNESWDLCLTEHAGGLVVIDCGLDDDLLLSGTSDEIGSVKIKRTVVVDRSLVEHLLHCNSVLFEEQGYLRLSLNQWMIATEEESRRTGPDGQVLESKTAESQRPLIKLSVHSSQLGASQTGRCWAEHR